MDKIFENSVTCVAIAFNLFLIALMIDSLFRGDWRLFFMCAVLTILLSYNLYGVVKQRWFKK